MSAVHDHEPFKNSLSDWGAAWSRDLGGAQRTIYKVGPQSPRKGEICRLGRAMWPHGSITVAIYLHYY